MSTAKKALGKGLSALIGTGGEPAPAPTPTEGNNTGVIEIDIHKIEPNKEQPRKYFDDESLMELADSLREYGVIQPIIVKEEDGYYSIIAGERRWRAARLAKLRTVPAIIKDYSPMEMVQVALIENIQRKDLNPIEEALCYKRLSDEYFFKQEEIAAKVGKSRNSISQSMSLLNLDGRVQNLIITGKLTAGQGRHLLSVKDREAQFDLAEKVIEEECGVRESEAIVKQYLDELEKNRQSTEAADESRQVGDFSDVTTAKPNTHSPNHKYVHVETDLKNILGTKVNIRDGKNKGKIEIEYYSTDELDRILGMFKRIDA